uniref:Uncharacterized protein n=1 Tax=Parascaris equorum TaxID=6256 RepID=A0A914RY65_PAREQ
MDDSQAIAVGWFWQPCVSSRRSSEGLECFNQRAIIRSANLISW